tara:strand:+ start:116 stop:1030 length:915 start_codon:yes stop_codon:yes gene_type:complete
MVTFSTSKFKDGYKKRYLHERSHLKLEFPQQGDQTIQAYIPFLENPEINEKGKSKLNTYDLVGRAGQLFSYGGADSRSLDLKFSISLLHVLDMQSTEGITEKFQRNFNSYFTGKALTRKSFNLQDGGAQGPGGYLAPEVEAFEQAAAHRNYYRGLIGQVTNTDPGNQIDVGGAPTGNSDTRDLDKTLDLIYYWINLVRGSVLNNSTNTLYGPPIVRLTHGPMYNNVPCLVEDYSVSIEEEAGYDVQTLTPKRVQVTMSLVESRTGNFGEYVPGTITDGDNLTGWESIIDNNSIDPYNGLIGSVD